MTNPDAEKIVGVLLAMGIADLVLPNAAIAEILPFYQPSLVRDGPEWLLGVIEWRKRQVPVVSITAASEAGRQSVSGRRNYIVVCNTPSGNPNMPYIGLLSLASPQLAHFRAADLVPAEQESANPFVLHALRYVGREAWIPDMDAIERALLKLPRLEPTA